VVDFLRWKTHYYWGITIWHSKLISLGQKAQLINDFCRQNKQAPDHCFMLSAMDLENVIILAEKKSLVACESDITGYQLRLIPQQPFAADSTDQRNGSVWRWSYFSKNICISLSVMALRNRWKNSKQVVKEDHSELIRKTSERTTEATSDWDLVWLQQTVVDEAIDGDRDPGLCLYKGATFWTFIVTSHVASPLLTCSR